MTGDQKATMAALEKLWNEADEDTRIDMERWVKRANNPIVQRVLTPEQEAVKSESKADYDRLTATPITKYKLQDELIRKVFAVDSKPISRTTFAKRMNAAIPHVDIFGLWSRYSGNRWRKGK